MKSNGRQVTGRSRKIPGAAALFALLAAVGFSATDALAQTASASPTDVVVGATVTASWSGFSGNVNVEVWKGGAFWVFANTNGPPSGSQGLVTTGWELRSDYRVKVVLKTNTSIFAFSNFFSVNNPSASASPSSVTLGETVVASWSGFTGNVNVEVWKGGAFWTFANTNAPGSGSQNLVTTGWEARSDYRVKIVLKTNTSIFTFSNFFTVMAPSASASPTSVTQGQTVVASWSGFSGNVNVEVWKGGAFWTFANTNGPGSGSQDLVTTGWEIRSDYRVKIVLKTNTSIFTFSNFFAVTQPASLNVTYPDGGETLYKGTNYTITWTSQNVTGNIQIDLYKGGTAPGNHVLQLAAGASNSGSYPFNPPTGLANGSDYKIGISAMSGTVSNFSAGFFTIASGTLNVTHPDGGETLYKGTDYAITWTSQNVTGNIQIDLYKGGTAPGNHVLQLAASAANSGTYPFNPPAGLANGSDYKIGISALGGTVSNFSAGFFTITSGTLDVTHPDGGESLYKGTDYAITWTSQSVTGNIQIDLYKGGTAPGNHVLQLAASAPNNGTYPFNPPTNLANGSDYKIGISAMSGTVFNFSAGYFTITGAGLDVTEPDGGETLFKGTDYTITWTSQNVTGNIQIDLYKGGTNVLQLAAGTADDGSYPFNPPASLASGTNYRIGISAQGGTVWNFSDGEFTITSSGPGFDYPLPNTLGGDDLYFVTQPLADHDGYYNAQDFLAPPAREHLGEDWNGDCGGDCDCGDTVYAAADGTIVYAGNAGTSWGNVLIVRHTLAAGEQIETMYGHLEQMLVTSGDVLRNQAIGTIGKDDPTQPCSGGYHCCHLHFEIRTDELATINPQWWGNPGPGYLNAAQANGWIDPSNFIDAHRPVNTPVLTLTSPSAGDHWQVGSTHAITWTSSNVTGAIQIQPYLAGQPLTNIAAAAPNTGSYLWTIPEGYATGADYQMSISTPDAYDFSDVFAISDPSEDSDADTVGDSIDNCPFTPNASQSDFDFDSEGDSCDTDDGLVYLAPSEPAVIDWDDEVGYQAWNLYRGDLSVLRSTGQYTQEPGSNALAIRACALAGSWYDDAGVPPSGQVAFYLVTGVADGTESGLGSNSVGQPRPNTSPCTLQPDLVVSAVDAPASVTAGGTITIANSVHNQGTMAAGSFTVGLYLSNDTTITTSDALIGTRAVSSLGAAQSSASGSTVTISVAPGTYYVGAIVDSGSAVSEGNELNNWLANGTLQVVTETSGAVVSDRDGFDKCEIPTVPQMQTWWNSSPYRDVNLYIGGANRGCPNTGLNATWVSNVGAQGWSFIPTWVGRQRPMSCCAAWPDHPEECKVYSTYVSFDPATAYNQGATEADAAASTADGLGLTTSGTSGTVIYLDIEFYDTGRANCRTAMESFVSGWVARMHQLGNRAGAYGSSCASGVTGWAALPNVPDDVWLASWLTPYIYRPDATVWGASCLPDSYWVNHQRIRQYAGDHFENWGGISLEIDSDVADGHVVAGAGESVTVETATSFPASAEPTTPGALQVAAPEKALAVVDGKLLSTRDGGLSWETVASPGQRVIAAATDSDSTWLQVSITEAAEGPVWRFSRSIDMGHSWETGDLAIEDEVGHVHIDFVSKDEGWLAFKLASSSSFSVGLLLRTTDGGHNWTRMALPAGDSIRFANRNTGWLAGGAAGDELYVTRDGGQSWSRSIVVPVGKTGQTQAFYDLPTFVDPLAGLLPITVTDGLGQRLELHATRDGGQTWMVQSALRLRDGIPQGVALPTAIHDMLSWIVVDPANGDLHRTRDGGRSFETIRVALPVGVVEMHFSSTSEGWVRTATGHCSGDKRGGTDSAFECSVSSRVLRTVDGGVTWSDVTPSAF